MKRISKPRTEAIEANKTWLMRAIWRSEKGQSLVELALLTPILLLLVVGIVEMGRYATLSIEVANAARAGAAYGSQNLATAANAVGIVDAALDDWPHSSGLTIAPGSGASYTTCGCDNGGTISAIACSSTCGTGHLVPSVSVKATGSFTSLFHYPGIPASLSVTNTATMRVRQQ